MENREIIAVSGPSSAAPRACCAPSVFSIARNVALLCIVISVARYPVLAQPPGSGAAKAVQPAVLPAPLPVPRDLAAYDTDWLNVPKQVSGAVALRLTIGGVSHIAIVEPHSLRGDRFQLVVIANGVSRPTTAPPPRTYRGWLDDVPGSVVALTAGPHGWAGAVLIPPPRNAGLDAPAESALPGGGEAELFGVQPLATLVKGDVPADAEGRIAHVAYRSSDALGDSTGRCGADDIASHGGAPADVGGIADGGVAGSGLRVADIAFDTDAEYLAHFGNDVDAALTDIETVMNGVDTMYQNQLAITYEITYVIIRTFGDPYDINASMPLLNALKTQWNANFFNVQRDLVHLMSGHSLDNSVIGIANIGQVCDIFNAYGLSITTFSPIMSKRFALTSHEIGHNWNANHCNETPFVVPDCRLMCATLCLCSGCATFEPQAVAHITAYKNSVLPTGCIPEIAPPAVLPFSDAFVGAELDRAKWTYVNNVNIFGGSVNPPSPPDAMLLNAAGPDDFQDDDVRSTFIQLQGGGDLVLSYFTEHRFVDAGEQLVVEYFANTLRWTEINRITSDGVDQDQFQFWAHTLPPAALHNQFRVRFRSEVNENNDQWFVDDVRIAAPGAIAVSAAPQPVDIAVSPSDANGAGNGLTPFERSYPVGVNVTLTAPLRVDSWAFVRWELAGVNQPLRQNVLVVPAPAGAALVAHYALLGDMDGNGRFDNFDIDPFVLALVNRPTYVTFFPDVEADIVGDYDGDGLLTNFDIEPFVDALIHLP